MSSFYIVEIISFIIIIALLYKINALKSDTYEEQKIKQELKYSEEKFRTLFNLAPVMLNSFESGGNGKCTLWNKECEKVFGFNIDEINQSENVLALFYPEEKMRNKVAQSFQEETYTFKEWHPIGKDGTEIITMWANIHLPNYDMISIGYDITDQRKAEILATEHTTLLKEAKNELARLNNSLEDRIIKEVEKNKQQQKMMLQQSRFAQMGETISMIAHQWRHPLNNLSLVIQDTIFQYRVNKLDQHTIGKLDKESSRQIKQMSNTITDFKNFFKPDKEKVNFNLNDVVLQSISIVQSMLESENIILDIDLQKKLTITGYPNELGQSIVNIISNAKDALVENEIINKNIKLSVSQQKDKIYISIEDNAGGISDDIISKIFDPYFSTKNEKNGTGLGLYITRLIIEDHMRGTLLASNTAQGALFKIIMNSTI